MWEKFKGWFLSNYFPWFMCGFCFATFLAIPDIPNGLLSAFWFFAVWQLDK